MRKALVVVHTGLSKKSRVKRKGYDQIEDLYLDGNEKNVEIRIQNIEERIVASLNPIARDLLEVAAVLYVADTSISRGKTDVYGHDWQRQITIVMPVRRVRKWRKASQLLSQVVTNLSGDASITFDFRTRNSTKKGQSYLEFPPSAPGFQGANRIVLFSGGLDSLAGTVDLVCRGETPLLITHRSSPARSQLQKNLKERIQQKKGCRLPSIHVWVTRKGQEAVDNSQRLRSFLYMSLAAVVAYELKINQVFFCENGITTFNLPLSDQRIGSRSTRTTNPKVIALFSRFANEVLSIDLQFENPFLFSTKRQVVERVISTGFADMVAQTLSCTRTFAVEKTKRHCGICFQCLIRRFSVVAANEECHDPVDDYVKDVFRSALEKGTERGNALDLVNFSVSISNLSP